MVPTFKYMSQRNLRAASLALLLFLYPIVALSFFSIRYMETVHRVTMSKVFDVSLFGSIEADSLAAVGFGLLFLGLSSRVRPAKLVFVAIFAVAVAGYVADRSELVIGALVIGPVITGLLAIAAIADRKDPLENHSQRLPFDGKRVAGAFLLIVIIIEAGAVGRWIAYPATGGEIYGDPSWKLAELESALFHSLGLLSPVLVVLLAFSFLYRWYVLNGIRRVAQAILPAGKATEIRQEREFVPPQRRPAQYASRKVEDPAANSNSSQLVTFEASNTLTSKHLHRGLLALALVVAPLLMIYPHLPMINPAGEGISTDEQYYVRWMAEFRNTLESQGGTLSNIVSNAFTINNGDRPLTLVLILALANVTGLPDLTVIRFLPVALAPALVASNYFLLKHTLDSRQYGVNRVNVFAGIGAVFAVFSPQIIVGEYAGFLANWIALTAAYFAFYLSVKSWESKERNTLYASIGLLFIVLVVTMLIHLYTWAHVLTIIVLFTFISFWYSRKSVSNSTLKLMLLLLVVAASFSIDYARAQYLDIPAAAQSDSALASNIYATDPGGKWDRLEFTLTKYVGGFLSNPALFLLALVWVVKTKTNGLSILILSMIFMFSIPAAIGSVEFQTRVLYNTPIHIAAVMGLMWIGNGLGRRDEDRILQKFLIVSLVLLMATYGLRAMANLPLQLPQGYQMDRQFLLP